jgi:hypothetical protein
VAPSAQRSGLRSLLQWSSNHYDANSNQVAAGTDSFTYDLAGRMTSATGIGGAGSQTYTYDGDGKRVRSVTTTPLATTTTDPLEPDVVDPYVSSYVYANQQPTVMTDPTGEKGRTVGSGDVFSPGNLATPASGAAQEGSSGGTGGFVPTQIGVPTAGGPSFGLLAAGTTDCCGSGTKPPRPAPPRGGPHVDPVLGSLLALVLAEALRPNHRRGHARVVSRSSITVARAGTGTLRRGQEGRAEAARRFRR